MKVIIDNGKIKVKSPYNTAFIKRARLIQGKWDDPYWVFPDENKEAVKDLLIDVYGECDSLDDGTISTVTVDIDVTEFGTKIGNITIAERPSRDRDVILAPNAMLISGGFPDSGGSAKYPRCDPYKGTIIRYKNLPTTIYEKVKDSKGIRLVTESVDIESLIKEKANLEKRITEIDALINLLEK